MKLDRYLGMAAIIVATTATTVAAQPAVSGNVWSYGTTINVFGGVTTASSSSAPLVGGAAGWELTPGFAVEGSVAWAEGSGREEAFAAALTAHANLTGPRTAVPFVKAGIGLYRASFSPRDEIPEFYRRRLREPNPLFDVRHTFTDPSFVFGGGVNVFTTRHLAIRPEVEALVVRGQSRSRLVTGVTMHVAYHFENHPVTPHRRRQ